MFSKVYNFQLSRKGFIKIIEFFLYNSDRLLHLVRFYNYYLESPALSMVRNGRYRVGITNDRGFLYGRINIFLSKIKNGEMEIVQSLKK